jgi:hypothetical protein
MTTQTRTTDQKARVILPRSFANATVIIEQISDTEVRIRKAVVIPEDEYVFLEEVGTPPLSDRDRDIFINLLENPPPPNEAFKRAAKRYKKKYGRLAD